METKDGKKYKEYTKLRNQVKSMVRKAFGEGYRQIKKSSGSMLTKKKSKNRDFQN